MLRVAPRSLFARTRPQLRVSALQLRTSDGFEAALDDADAAAAALLNDGDEVVAITLPAPSAAGAAPTPAAAAAPAAVPAVAPVAAPAPALPAPPAPPAPAAAAPAAASAANGPSLHAVVEGPAGAAAPSVSLLVQLLGGASVHMRASPDAPLSALSDALLPLLLPNSAAEAATVFVRVDSGDGRGERTRTLLLPRGVERTSVAALRRMVAESLAAEGLSGADGAPLPPIRLAYGGRFLTRPAAALADYAVSAASTLFGAFTRPRGRRAPAGGASRDDDDGDDDADAEGADLSAKRNMLDDCGVLDVDLFLPAHGLYATPETAKLPLSAWGLAALADGATVYASLRSGASRHSGAARTHAVACFDAGAAWQLSPEPGQEQSDAGMAAALCALRALVHAPGGTAAASRAASALLALVPFLPAAAALRSAMRGAVLHNADKAALAAAMLPLLRALMPPAVEPDERRLFEHAPACLALLLDLAQRAELAGNAAGAASDACPPAGQGDDEVLGDADDEEEDEEDEEEDDEEADAPSSEWRDVALHDAFRTHTRLVDPVRCHKASGALGPLLFSRESALRQWGADAQLVPDAEAAALLLAHPAPALDAQLWSPPTPALAARRVAEAASVVEAAAALRAMAPDAWHAEAAAAMQRCPSAKPLRVLQPLALKRARSTALTLGADGLHRVFLGAQPCSSRIELYDPRAPAMEAVDPDELAAALASAPASTRARLASAAAADADDRVPEEILCVVLDTSNSMSTTWRTTPAASAAAPASDESDEDAGDDDDEDDDAGHRASPRRAAAPTVRQMRDALAEMCAAPQTALLAALARRSRQHEAAVEQLLTESSPVLAAMLAPGSLHAERVREALSSAGTPRQPQPRLPLSSAALARAAVPTHCVSVSLPADLRKHLACAPIPPDRLVLPAAPSYTVATLKLIIQERTGVPPERQRLKMLAFGIEPEGEETPDDETRSEILRTDLTNGAATLRDVCAWNNATLQLQLSPGAPLQSLAERAAAAAAPPELIYFEVEAEQRRKAVKVVADAAWVGSRVALEIFAKCAELAPATHTFFLAPKETGDGFFSAEATMSAANSGFGERPLRQLVSRELRAGRGLDPRLPIVVRPYKDGTQTERAARERRGERRISRIAAVRELFTSLANRLAGSNLPIRTALVTFDDASRLVCAPTALIERFIADVRDAEPAGGTALWDALTRAIEVVDDGAKAVTVLGAPPPRRRLLVLSDGEDTCSADAASASAVARSAVARNVVIDAFLIGEAASGPGSVLHAVATATGGLCFAPASIRDALQQVELETLLWGGERPPARAPASMRTLSSDSVLLACHGRRGKLYTQADDLPPRRDDPATRAAVVLGADTVEDASLHAGGGGGGGGSASAAPAMARSNACVRRIIQEFRAVRSADTMGAEMVAAIDVYPLASDVGVWRLVLPGWEGTPYVGGTFALTVRFPATYPTHPPEVRFDTRILHPNVNAYGKVCAAILGPEWAHAGTGLRMPTLLRSLVSLFAAPETANPVNSALALDYYATAGKFAERVAAHVAQHAAGKSREQWRAELQRLSEGA